VTDGIHAVVLIQLNGMSSNAGGLLQFQEYIQPLGPIAPTIGTVKSCRINTARSCNWRPVQAVLKQCCLLRRTVRQS